MKLPKPEVRSQKSVGASRPLSAFTLLEVMIAMGIFFMFIFAILELVSTNLRHVQRLQKPTVDIGSLASELSLTNKLSRGRAKSRSSAPTGFSKWTSPCWMDPRAGANWCKARCPSSSTGRSQRWASAPACAYETRT